MSGILNEADKKDYKLAEGDIKKLTLKERQGDNLIKFTLMGDDYRDYSLFGSFPFAEGDHIKFKYLIKDGRYYNVKEILDFDNVHKKPNQEDVNLMKKQLNGFDDRTIKTLLMKGSIDLCLARNELKDKEIFACYQRFLEVIA